MATMRYVVRGYVQGVGFRDFVRRLADRYEVAGEVWNRADGAVETIAQHADDAMLEAFGEELRFGPGRVDSLHAEPYDPSPEYDGFRVTFLG